MLFRSPTYFIYGGMIFQPLTKNYLEAWGDEWREKAPTNLKNLYESEPTKDSVDQQIVILNRILKYEDLHPGEVYEEQVVEKINGQPIRSMKDLIRTLELHEGLTHEIALQNHEVVYLNRHKAEDDQRVLERYLISKAASEDLQVLE